MAKIVVGVDGSPGAAQALEWAVAEAGLRKAALHVVHAWMVPLIDAIPEAWVIGAPTIGPTDEEVYEHLAAAAQEGAGRGARPGAERWSRSSRSSASSRRCGPRRH